MSIKYQIFVSSTYDDLRKEREQVLKATLEMGHIPVGMEMFSAADEEQWKIITRQIDECDYYVVIVAHRYGSVVDGISYTEKEYDYAVSKNIPVLGFIIENNITWPPNYIDADPDQKSSLENFKVKLKKKPVSFWSSESDLYGKFSIALMKQIASIPRPGWTRATDVVSPDVTNELSRLSSENAELREQLQVALHQAEDDAIAERRKIRQTMIKNKVTISFYYNYGSEWEDETEFTLSTLFYLLAPEMMIEKDTEDIAWYVGLMLRPNKDRQPRTKYPVPANNVKHWISDFIALGVFEPSQEQHSVSDKSEYWALTDLGREMYMDIRRTRLEKAVSEPTDTKSAQESDESH